MDEFEFAAKLTESLAWPIVAIVAIAVFRRDAKAGLDRLRKLDAFGVSAEFDLARLEQAVDEAVEETKVTAQAYGHQDSQTPADGQRADHTRPPSTGSKGISGESPPPTAPQPGTPPGPAPGPAPTAPGAAAVPVPDLEPVPTSVPTPTPLEPPAPAPVVLSPAAMIFAEWSMLERLLRGTYLDQPMFAKRGDRMPALTTVLDGLMTIGAINKGHREAILYARDVRNKIAHAKHDPTVEEARRYAQAAGSLRELVMRGSTLERSPISP